MKVGSSEHRSVLRKTGKTCQETVLTLIIDYVLICDHQVACLSKMELFQELFIFLVSHFELLHAPNVMFNMFISVIEMT